MHIWPPGWHVRQPGSWWTRSWQLTLQVPQNFAKFRRPFWMTSWDQQWWYAIQRNRKEGCLTLNMTFTTRISAKKLQAVSISFRSFFSDNDCLKNYRTLMAVLKFDWDMQQLPFMKKKTSFRSCLSWRLAKMWLYIFMILKFNWYFLGCLCLWGVCVSKFCFLSFLWQWGLS